ncbi:MAG: HemK2/MTQ2 family protein methyltransferase [archaeon]
MSVYEPREDSYLILKQVSKFAKGKVLDMGTGSGVLAIEAAKYADEVLAVDINVEAVNKLHTRIKKEKLKNIKSIQSDLFENVDGKYDLITFNPPYLPNDPEVKDIALDGGPEGYEVIERFLKKAREHMGKDGKILLLFSSLSKKEQIHKILKELKYSYEQVTNLPLDFEILYVYVIK